MLIDLIKFEKITLNSNFKNIDNFYFFANKELNQTLEIWVLELKKHQNKNFIKNLIKLINLFNELPINFNDFSFIKNTEQLVFSFICFFLFKSLLNPNSMLLNEEGIINGHSDAIINNSLILLKKLLIWIEIFHKKESKMISKELRYLIISISCFLVKHSYLKKEKTSFNNKTYLSFDHKLIINLIFINNIIIPEYKFQFYRKEKKIFIYSCHFSFIEDIYIDNIFNKENFQLLNENQLLDQLCSTWVYINKSDVQLYYDCLLKKNLLFSDQIEKKYLKLQQEIKTCLLQSDIKAAKTLMQQFSEIIFILDLKKILSLDFENSKIYLPFKFDFRGRLYFLSKFSPTFNKAIRNALHWGMYEKSELETLFHPFNELIENALNPSVSYLKEKNFMDIINKPVAVQYAIVWLLISLAETCKIELKKEVSLSKFVNKGLEIINSFDSKFNAKEDIEKFVKIQSIINTLKDIKNNIFKKKLISKDATASVYQHLIKTLGWKNDDALRWCNLNSKDTWYDTYSFIIDMFKSLVSRSYLTELEFNMLFTRKSLKKTIMTNNYGSTEYSCWNTFLNVNEEYIQNLSIEKKNEIRLFFKFFYNFIHEDDKFFYISSDKIHSTMLEKNFLLTIENDALVNLKYYKTLTKSIEIYVQNERFIKQEFILTSVLDEKKIKSSIRANYVHSLDSALVRWILKQVRLITIHDCFMIDYINITYLVAKINEGMRITFDNLKIEKPELNDKIFSIFIIL